MGEKMLRETVLHLLILGVISLVMGLTFYTIVRAQQFITLAYNTARSSVVSVVHGGDPKKLAEEVMAVYGGLSEEQLAARGTEEYRAHFAEIEQSHNYDVEHNILMGFTRTNNVYDVYLGMYDRERDAMVYFADGDLNEETNCKPGDWDYTGKKETARFLDWDGVTGICYDIGNTEGYGWLCTAGVPLTDDTGRVYAFVLCDVRLGDLLRSMRDFSLQFALVVIAATMIISLLSARKIRRGPARDLNAIAEAAQRYTADRRNGITDTQHFSSLGIRSGDEIENLATIMLDMEQQLSDYEANLTAVTAEKERIATELEMAAAIQSHMLPSTFPVFTDRPEFEIYASMRPAKEVGGDFYDFFTVDSDHLALTIADVSGKGVPAALFMMTSRTMIKDAALSGISPAAVLKRVNAQLCENNPDCMFVTVWLGILEISTGRLTWADAGHEPLILWQDGAWKVLPKPKSPAAAAFEPELLELDSEPAFRDSVLQLRPGDAVFQYTDGVTEAMTGGREQFGRERLLAALAGTGSAEPEKLLAHVRACVDEFVQGAPQFDDITMLCLEYKGAAGVGQDRQKE